MQGTLHILTSTNGTTVFPILQERMWDGYLMMSFHQSKSQEASLDPTPPHGLSTDHPGCPCRGPPSFHPPTFPALAYQRRNECMKTWPITLLGVQLLYFEFLKFSSDMIWKRT